jgi:hypothetical protein
MTLGTTRLPIAQIRADGNTQPRAGLNEDAVKDYMLDMLEGDEFKPIVVFYDGDDYWLSAGFHRITATQRLGRTDIEAIVKDGGPREAFLYAVEDNRKNGVRYTTADKQAMVQRFLDDSEWRTWSDREIARKTGVSYQTVANYRSSLSNFDSDERQYVTKHGTVATMHTANIGRPIPLMDDPDDDELLSAYEEQLAQCYVESALAHMPSAIDDNDEVDTLLSDTQPIVSRNDHIMRVMGSSESPEWYTPRAIVDRVISFFEVIHTDPCSNSKDTPNVPAEIVYTKTDNGLMQPWKGNVYMNPPYGDEIPAWTERMVQAYRDEEINQAIALLPGRIDTQWFQPLYAYLICNVRGRLRFENAENSAPFPSVIVYLGKDEPRFIRVFSELGPIMRRIA